MSKGVWAPQAEEGVSSAALRQVCEARGLVGPSHDPQRGDRGQGGLGAGALSGPFLSSVAVWTSRFPNLLPPLSGISIPTRRLRPLPPQGVANLLCQGPGCGDATGLNAPCSRCAALRGCSGEPGIAPSSLRLSVLVNGQPATVRRGLGHQHVR